MERLGRQLSGLLRFWPLVLLASLAVAIYSAGPIDDLKIMQAQDDLGSIETALAVYRAKHGRLPSQTEGLGALTGPGEPLEHLGKDPWLNAYVYRHAPGTDTYFIYSPGLNHIDEGGSGDDVIVGEKSYRCADYGINCPPSPRRMTSLGALALAVLSLCVGLVRMGMSMARDYRRPREPAEPGHVED